MSHFFQKFSQTVADATGSSWAFIAAFLLVVFWLIAGPIFHFSDTWQLVMNTISSIVTFLIAFLIQHSQNRDTKALQLKLDELIASQSGARNSMIDIEEMTDEEIQRLQEQLRQLGKRYQYTSNSLSNITENKNQNQEKKND